MGAGPLDHPVAEGSLGRAFISVVQTDTSMMGQDLRKDLILLRLDPRAPVTQGMCPPGDYSLCRWTIRLLEEF